jgi:hypothetical protein
MIKEFAWRFQKKTGQQFDTRRHIRQVLSFIANAVILLYDRCLAHIINLATQALISTHSKAKYYNPNAAEEHIPDVDAWNRDEVGLIRTICVKASLLYLVLGYLSYCFAGTFLCSAKGALQNSSGPKRI